MYTEIHIIMHVLDTILLYTSIDIQQVGYLHHTCCTLHGMPRSYITNIPWKEGNERQLINKQHVQVGIVYSHIRVHI